MSVTFPPLLHLSSDYYQATADSMTTVVTSPNRSDPSTGDKDNTVHPGSPDGAVSLPTSQSPLPAMVKGASKFDAHLIDYLRRSDSGLYVGAPNLALRAEFFMGGLTGDILVPKNSGKKPPELLLSGIFEIDWQNFFMAPDGGYTLSNAFNRSFVDTKLSCQLIAVQRDANFALAHSDFSAVITNIKALEKLIPQKKGNTSVLCIHDTGGQIGICINHALFAVCCHRHLPINTNIFVEKGRRFGSSDCG